jgi:shikimate kinase
MKIFLIGLPGSGKSQLGKSLALSLQLPFVDLDDEIVVQEGKPVTEIFKEKGEPYFRKVETELLRKRSTALPAFVMATGGGAPCFHNNMEFINNTGVSVFLDISISTIIRRMTIQQQKQRPLLIQDGLSLEETYTTLRDARLPFYQQAQLTIEGNEITASLVLQMLNIKK